MKMDSTHFGPDGDGTVGTMAEDIISSNVVTLNRTYWFQVIAVSICRVLVLAHGLAFCIFAFYFCSFTWLQ